jgi:hypothetical protein
MGVKIGGGLTWDEVKRMDIGMDVCGLLKQYLTQFVD